LVLANDTCPTINTYVNDSQGPANDDDLFEEILLYDGPRKQNFTDVSGFRNVVYATIVEQDVTGYDHTVSNGATYDFQMILPEVGLDTWSSSTAYYFYVELS